VGQYWERMGWPTLTSTGRWGNTGRGWV